MAEKPKSTILEKYDRAISALPLKEQVERANKIRSPKLIRRFLSENAPKTLRIRFATRYKEAADLPVLDEVHAIMHSGEGNAINDAKEKAINEAYKDPRAYIPLAEMYAVEPNERSEYYAIESINRTVRAGVDNARMHSILGTIHFRRGEFSHSDNHYQIARDMEDNPEIRTRTAKREEGMKDIRRGHYKKAVKTLEELAEEGDYQAAVLLLSFYNGSYGNEEKDFKKAVKYCKQVVSRGFTARLPQLGLLQEANGDIEAAIETFELAAKAYNPKKGYFMAWKVAQEHGLDDKASHYLEILEKMEESWDSNLYFMIAARLLSFGDETRAHKYLKKGLKKYGIYDLLRKAQQHRARGQNDIADYILTVQVPEKLNPLQLPKVVIDLFMQVTYSDSLN